MVRQFAFILVSLTLSFNSFSQINKKYFGTYVGTLPAYEFNSGLKEPIVVASAALEINLSNSSIEVLIGSKLSKGVWKLVSENKINYVIECNMDNSVVTERILIYKKGKQILREGIRPQLDVMLKKVKRR